MSRTSNELSINTKDVMTEAKDFTTKPFLPGEENTGDTPGTPSDLWSNNPLPDCPMDGPYGA